MATIREQLLKIENYGELAVKNCENHYRKYGISILDDETTRSVSESLNASFEFSKSPEGSSFWLKILQELELAN